MKFQLIKNDHHTELRTLMDSFNLQVELKIKLLYLRIFNIILF